MSDLILKEILGICGTKNTMKEQIEEYKLTEREIFGKFDNLSEDELSSKWNEKVYVRNDAMTSVINRCRGEKKNVKKKKKNRWIQKKVDDSRIWYFRMSECPEFEVK